jgi:hypothetical protein
MQARQTIMFLASRPIATLCQSEIPSSIPLYTSRKKIDIEKIHNPAICEISKAIPSIAHIKFGYV